jgi:hypothetical protein
LIWIQRLGDKTGRNKKLVVGLLTQTLNYFHSFLLTAVFSLALLMATDGGKKAARVLACG